MKVKCKATGEIKDAVYACTPKGNWRFHIDGRPISDKDFLKKYTKQ
jgi:hypothetical protein